ncbi:hypothetical protein V2H45_23340 [Tumidithrix elongata RA019]|uniref:Translation elongation factor n=1 Tax=Tumidithrix elongata BACA0141 TaxID=2716417 RepID=A0AAW9Q839_9CYAN|nr:hypothetical protein [Tumidithrix elongata RA019]
MSSSKEKTKNDLAWEEIFKQYQILDKISKYRFYEIESSLINNFRESRLMAKFDHYVNLPEIFREHNLSILPISRSRYVIGNFNTHFKVKYNEDIEITPVEFQLNIETLDYNNLYSETSMLHCAFITKMIDHLVEEQTFQTVSGRMSTDSFSFNIRSSIDLQPYQIEVQNSQCEIDAGFESDNYFILIEAKKGKVEDFLIRQLYYPYRLWQSKTSKKVLPILMTYSYDIFSFFIYDFNDESEYNSIELVKQIDFQISPEEINREDVSNVLSQINPTRESQDIPFPQANDFGKVIDLLDLLVEKDLTKEDIAENYQFNLRQSDYYANAGAYIGLIQKYKNHIENKTFFNLTSEAKSLLRRRHKAKYLGLIAKILEDQIFYQAFKLTNEKGEVPSANSRMKCNGV